MTHLMNKKRQEGTRATLIVCRYCADSLLEIERQRMADIDATPEEDASASEQQNIETFFPDGIGTIFIGAFVMRK
jgi:hypothetical protein